jgi:hypothetical protein
VTLLWLHLNRDVWLKARRLRLAAAVLRRRSCSAGTNPTTAPK